MAILLYGLLCRFQSISNYRRGLLCALICSITMMVFNAHIHRIENCRRFGGLKLLKKICIVQLICFQSIILHDDRVL